MTQLLLYAVCNTLNPRLIRHIYNSTNDIALRKCLIDTNYIDHVCSAWSGLSLLDIARKVSGCQEVFAKGVLSINRAKQFRWIQYRAKIIILTEDELVIITYEFYRNNYREVSQEHYDLDQFSTGFVYLVLLGADLHVFKTREEAVAYGVGMSNSSKFSVYVIRTVHLGTPYYTYMGSNDFVLDDQFREEIQARMKNLPDEKLYYAFMEYIGYEVDIYSKDGRLIQSFWDNGTTKSYLDFLDPNIIADMRIMHNPLLWERVEEEC